MKISKKHEEPQMIYLTTEKIKAKRSENSYFFKSEVVASKVWCYIRTTITSKNRHVICDLAHGDDQNFSKIAMIKEINYLTLCGCVR